MDRPGKAAVYYDPEGDFMEVTFERRPGFFRETEDDRFMEKVDAEDPALGWPLARTARYTGLSRRP
ncbi:Hypothetical Protein RradSPS_3116 (plasmid) [Rubrobacter radiotolerans]|uniref:Uncharacterized protein n=1 Tax=Rubrobacter radiotolerans TaxID=42256 RepID=A0A023X8M5_RUBRA|nr:hypothetical protein [Rubrobacter radiotolerans]AHY48399.1 Hypothetical Protein RradSPS_3116 [Rubrobacter radiotolerans]MDX5895626.1 hypothetical protein [Rubrobacter radiotolerans]SMC01409.1 hypothetical protein SAMN00767673_3227 [Rubrobacter radiotolerans DSM 5868]